MDLETLYQHILCVYKKCKIVSFPIDCFSIVRQYGYNIVEYIELSPKKMAACQALSKDACLVKDTLYYESRNVEGRIRFSMMHELGHIILSTNSEDDADIFASHILAPRIIIHSQSCRRVDYISNQFGLSQMASNRALADYNDWFYKISHQRENRNPSEPELLLKKRFSKKKVISPRPVKPSPASEPVKKTFLETTDDDYTDEMLFERLKNNPHEKSRAAMMGLRVEEYLMYRYNFKFDKVKQPMAF